MFKRSKGFGFWPQEFVLLGRGNRFESLSQSLLGEFQNVSVDLIMKVYDISVFKGSTLHQFQWNASILRAT
jgi:hypothetical protein